MKKDYATDFNLKYNPQTYWTGEVGKTYRERFVYGNEYKIQEQALINFLRPLRFKSVLEVGCGFGRITDLMLEHFYERITKYDAVDISHEQIDQAVDYVRDDERLSFYPIAISEIAPRYNYGLFSTMAQGYDLVLSVEVLMHIPPDQLRDTVWKLAQMCRCHIVHVDWQKSIHDDDPCAVVDPINFSHDYNALYYDMYGGKTSKRRQKEIPIPHINQSIFWLVLPP